VPLVNCPECSRQVSTAADACPQCGHPMQPASPAPVGPKCHACAAAATTRCQRCGALSCVQHLQSIYVMHGRGAYELRCERCYSDAKFFKALSGVLFGVFILLLLLFLLVQLFLGT
jgi:hypothetical protein